VRSYRTISTLPDPVARPSAVYFLWHFPSAHAAQALPGTLPCGARTFLYACAQRLSGRLHRQLYQSAPSFWGILGFEKQSQFVEFILFRAGNLGGQCGRLADRQLRKQYPQHPLGFGLRHLLLGALRPVQ
jgi:hypothetical protein